MESRDHAFYMADALVDLANELDVGLIFKTSEAPRRAVGTRPADGRDFDLKT